MSHDNPQEGAFLLSLKRNNDKIREDRALAIAEDDCIFEAIGLADQLAQSLALGATTSRGHNALRDGCCSR